MKIKIRDVETPQDFNKIFVFSLQEEYVGFTLLTTLDELKIMSDDLKVEIQKIEESNNNKNV